MCESWQVWITCDLRLEPFKKYVTLEGREGLDVVLQIVTGEGKEFCNVWCQLVVKIFLNTFNTFIEINSLLGFD